MAEVVCQPIDYSHPSWAKRRRYRSPSPTPERSRKACREHPSVNVCLEDPPSGFIKEAMTFDGIASSIEAPQPPCNVGGDEGLTVAAWVKRSKDDVAWDRLIDFGNGAEKENVVISFQEQTMYEVRNGDGVQQLAVGTFTGPGASTQMSFPSDRWMHIALVHDKDGIASIYWNGALKARGPVWLPPPVHREKYYVGRSHWTHDPYFKGEISDVHVFNYALNHHEVDKACFSRSLPTGSRGKPILSLASGWRTDAPRKLPVLSWPSRGPTGHSCGCHGCGGFGHCGGGGGAEGNPLQFFTGLKGLERITFNSNNIESIPVGINCPKLESFLISQNSLTELPPDMPLWPKLKILFVNANSLQRLPETFLQNTWIERINLARNSKCTSTSKHILQHLKKVTEQNKGMYWAPDTL